MKFQKMALLSLLFASVVASAASEAELKNKPAPFLSSEGIKFLDKSMPMIGFLEPKAFEGILVRQDTKSDALYYIDLYSLSPTNQIAVDDGLCRHGAERAIGPLKEFGKAEKPKFFATRFGQACELVLKSDSKTSEIKERRFVVAFIQGRPYVFMAKFEKEAKPKEAEELRNFVQSLYVDPSSPPKEADAKKPTQKPSRLPASL